MVKHMGKLGLAKTDRENRLAATAMMIGGVAIARALDDKETVDELLEACRKFGLALPVTLGIIAPASLVPVPHPASTVGRN